MPKTLRQSTNRLLQLGLTSAATLLVVSCGSPAAPDLIGSSNSVSDIVRLSVAPQSAHLLAGDNLTIMAWGHRRNGDSTVVQATWSTTVGSLAGAGVVHVDQGGMGTVRAVMVADPALSASAEVEVATIELTPLDVTVSAGGSIQVNSIVVLPDSSVMWPPVTWSATGGTISPTGIYSAPPDTGTYQVLAQFTGHTASASLRIKVTPVTLQMLVLNPAAVSMLTGETRQFSLAALWSNGSTTVPAVTWSATGGTISSSGLFTASPTAGVFRVIAVATTSGLADTSTVTISLSAPTLTQLIVSPKTLALNTGAAQQFGVSATWSDGSSSAPLVTWAAIGGTITTNGLFSGGTTPGAFRVIATQQGGTKADTATVTISIPVTTLLTLVLNPQAFTIMPGATQQFSVAGGWSDGSSAAPAVTYAATGGTITPAGLYTAGTTSGSFRVIATQQGGTKADTSTVIVAAPLPTLTSLTISPRFVTITPGGTQQFTVSGVWSNGLRTTPNVIYAGTGGAIAANGSYSAEMVPGNFRVIATQQGGNSSDTAVVTVTTLRLLAASRGFLMGAAVNIGALRTDSLYRQTLIANYNSVVPENVMKFAPIHPDPLRYSFYAADEFVRFAQDNGMVIHGPVLVWHESLPTWVTSGSFTRSQLLMVLKDHIETVVGRYRGQIATWDVVNEALNYDGSLRRTIWYQTIGPDYIDSAFVWANRADPAARLYLNENSAEWLNAKADSLLALVQRLRSRGVPVHGVGFQSHFTTTPPPGSSVRANLARFANAGIDIRVSEMDVRIADGGGISELDDQARIYVDVLDACLLTGRCVDFTTWGYTDRYSWIPAYLPTFGRALPFDSSYQPKAAFGALATRLAQTR